MKALALILFLPLAAFAQSEKIDAPIPPPWPTELEWPRWIEHKGKRKLVMEDGRVLAGYNKAQNTQSIATTNNRPSIDAVPIHTVNNGKWTAPGGVVGIDRARSYFYAYRADGSKQYQTRLPVLNRFNNYQYEIGWTREYTDGTVFLDSLSYEGKSFEVRQREKVKGEWKSSVLYRDKTAFPPGYKSPSLNACTNCHSEAGTGGYAVGLVPGGDGVLSDPFPGIE